MLPFQIPNPYGSYFNFGDPENMASQSFSGKSGGLDPSVLSMMGAPVAGMNPTNQEFQRRVLLNRQQEQFMASVLRSDPRASALAGVANKALFGDDDAKRRQTINQFGGQGNMNEMIGYMLNMPGISGHLGGSIRSLGLGAMSISTSGMSVGGVSMPGYGAIQELAAKQIFGKVQNQFYTSSGGANVGATQGLNKDQIGGIMSMGAAQGAFAGLDLGKISQVAGKSQFNMDQGTIKKITDFTKSAAKAISGLIDIYGNGTITELMQKAEKITGLNMSRYENVGVINNRLKSLRATSEATGVDVQTVMDTAAGATGMLGRMGITGGLGGAMGGRAAQAGAEMLQAFKRNSGQMYLPSMSMQEMAAGVARDSAGMLMDPVGGRRAAVELLIQNKQIKPEDAAAIRETLAKASPDDLGRIDNEIQEKYKISLPAFIRSYGGPVSLGNFLKEDGRQNLIDANSGDMSRRQVPLIRDLATGITGREGSGSIAQLMDSVSLNTGLAIGAALDNKEGAEGINKIFDDPTTHKFIPRGDRAGIIKSAMDYKRSIGDQSMEGAVRSLRGAMNSNPLTQTHRSREDRASEIDARLHSAQYTLSEEDRGNLSKGLVQGLMDRVSGDDPRSALALTIDTTTGAVLGLGKNAINLDRRDHLNPDGSLNVESVNKTAHNLMQQLDTNNGYESHVAKARIFGTDMDAIRKGKQFNAVGAEQFIEKFESPLSRMKMLEGFDQFGGVAEGKGFTLLVTKDQMAKAPERMTGRLASKYVEMFGGEALRSDSNLRFLKRAAEALGGAKGAPKLTPEEAEALNTKVIGRMSDYAGLKQLDAAQIGQLAKLNKPLGKSMASSLFLRQQKIEADFAEHPEYTKGANPEEYKERSVIKKQLDALSAQGIVPAEAAGFTRITGTLKLVGPRELEFFQTQMKGPQ